MDPVILKSSDQVLRAEQVDDGVVHIHLSNFLARRIGFGASCYLVDDVLIDSGFPNAGRVLMRYLEDKSVRAVCCTHNHEDHAGNCGRLARRFKCPVYLRHPDSRWDEGVDSLLPYRRIGWGKPESYQPQEMPSGIQTRLRKLQAIATPGHSRTHTIFFDEKSRLLFVGDLFIGPAAGAVMSHENPYDSIRSLRRAAGLDARLMLNGHGLVTGDVSRRLARKADRIEAAASQVLKLHARGRSPGRIVRQVFPQGNFKDRIMSAVTQGEFCRLNFVRACIRHREQPAI